MCVHDVERCVYVSVKIRHIIQMADDVKCEVFAFRHTQTIRNVYCTSHYMVCIHVCML